MRTENIGVKMTIPIPYDRPDGNKVVYSREAVEKAINNLHSKLPIVFMGNREYEPKVVGCTTENKPKVVWDEESKTCMVEIDGMIFHGGSECIADIKDGIVSSFSITGFGISI